MLWRMFMMMQFLVFHRRIASSIVQVSASFFCRLVIF